MSTRSKLGGLAAIATALLVAAPAQAQSQSQIRSDSKGVYSGKVALTGFFYTESDGINLTGDESLLLSKLATSTQLGFGELRATVDARRIAKERIDFRLDVRLRLTGDFNFETKFTDDFFDKRKSDNNLGLSARGYLGGSEYDLREAYVNVRFSESFGLQLGRMFINEADNIKLDAVRLWRRFGPNWTGTVFAGGYPNPYSRSLLTDYAPPCGNGVAADIYNPATEGRCIPPGLQLGVGAGVGARYSYDRLWGSVGLVGSFFKGEGDGGNVQPDPNARSVMGMPTPPITQSNLLPADGALDAPRVFLSWLNSWRPAERFDLFSDLVIDAYGSAGPQLTRLVLLGSVRLLPNDRLTMRVGASYLSSLAVNMFLSWLNS